jgi:isopenicillin N synthase-like dioxygenase
MDSTSTVGVLVEKLFGPCTIQYIYCVGVDQPAKMGCRMTGAVCSMVGAGRFWVGLVVLLIGTVVRGSLALSPPVIDISSLFVPSSHAADIKKIRVAQKIDNALMEFGVFVAVGHPIPSNQYEHAIDAGYGLFRLPIEAKQNVSIDKLGGIGRGYLSFGKESGVASYFEPKEGYSYGYEFSGDGTQEHPLQRPNTWPDGFAEEDRTAVVDLYNSKIEVAKVILEAISSLSKDGSHGDHSIDYLDAARGGETISIMRLFHYFPNSYTRNVEGISGRPLIGSSPHTDWGYLTLIAHDGVKGLQFLHDDQWNDVDNVPNGLVVNGGDYLHIISRGRYHSPVHRVLCPEEDNHRLSFVLFFYPGHNQTLQLNTATNECDANNSDACSNENSIHKKEDFEFNTLMVEGNDTAAKTVKFGDYIMKKWQGVIV